MLARILIPDSGRIVIDGRVSALLELGAGFHPEYSAVENIFLSGAFYGMSRSQLKPRVDSIIAFAELERSPTIRSRPTPAACTRASVSRLR